MSRSYKHTPVKKDLDYKNFAKINANRSYRRKMKSKVWDEDEILPKNKQYRKDYEQWEIHDCIWYKSYRQARREYAFYCTPNAYYSSWNTYDKCLKYAKEFKAAYPTLESYINNSWKKIYYWK